MKSKRINTGKQLITLLEEYLEEVTAQPTKKGGFPSVAGFCRHIGISVSRFRELRSRFPEEFELAGAYFEDAALSSGATATLIGMYLKHYSFWNDERPLEVECDHDIFDDGV